MQTPSANNPLDFATPLTNEADEYRFQYKLVSKPSIRLEIHAIVGIGHATRTTLALSLATVPGWKCPAVAAHRRGQCTACTAHLLMLHSASVRWFVEAAHEAIRFATLQPNDTTVPDLPY